MSFLFQNWTGFGENQAVVEPLVLAKGSRGTATPEGDRGGCDILGDRITLPQQDQSLGT